MLNDISSNNIDITTGSYVNLSYLKATPIRRIFAIAIDWAICFTLFALFDYLETRCSNDIGNLFANLMMFFCVSFFNLTCEYFFNGRTFGKMIVRIQVMTDECTPPSFLQCLMRWVVFPIDFFLIGLILINKNGKRIGDIASGCNVVRSTQNTKGVIMGNEHFAFANLDYKPQYPKAQNLSPKDKNLIHKALHDSLYQAYRNEIAKHIADVLYELEPDNSYKFLQQVEQDYKYYENIVPERKSANT